MSVAKKVRTLLLCLFAVAAFVGIVLLLFGMDDAANQRNLDLLASYGWQTDPEPEEISHLRIPDTFSAALDTYNRVIKQSGFDLLPYRGVRVVRYTYRVRNHKNGEQVRIHVFTAKNEIIAADLSSFAGEGFLLPISDLSGQTEPLSV